MRILFVAHGYPPRETAGTERHVEALAQHARAAGHSVAVLAATRSPGRRPYATWTDEVDGVEVHRLVNNVPTRSLARAESDPLVDRWARAQADRFRPDVVHIHHLQFLSSSIEWPCPTVVTLHDQWHWCPAGGLGVRADGQLCPEPTDTACPPCAQAWAPSPGVLTRGLSRVAGRLGPWVGPDALHRAWTRIPARLRPAPERGVGPIATPAAAHRRQVAMHAVLRQARQVVSPSRWLAERCRRVTGVSVRVVPHGLAPAWHTPRSPGPRRGIAFLGTIAPHKGPHLVLAAWRRAFPDGTPPLALHGQLQDPRLVDGYPVGPVLGPSEVRRLLDRSEALVMGSTWPENAPLVLLEARARGCPVVAPAIGGIPELVTPRDGELVAPGNVAALAAGMARVVGGAPRTPRPPPTLAAQATELLEILAAAGATG